MTDPSSPVAGTPSSAEPAATSLSQSGSRAQFLQSPADRSLDQWRGLALVLVLISHGFFFTGHVPGVGRAGVNLFFFVSGILVFRSLAKGPQQLAAGARSFWTRRIRRLMPAKYFYLLCMILLVLVVWMPPVTAAFRNSFFCSLPSSFLYYRNYYVGSDPSTTENLTGHLWSLACELQFYLLAPLIFFAGGRSLARQCAVFSVVLALMLAGGLSVINKTSYSPYTFQVAAWPMMAGFFAEFLRRTFPRPCAACGQPLVIIGALSFLVLAWAVLGHQADYGLHKKIVILAGTLLVAGCLGCYLQGLAPGGPLGNAFHYLGNRTYSIYLWQQPLTLGGLVPATIPLSDTLFLPVHLIGALLSIPIGALSFRFLEMPFMSKYQKPAAKPQ